MTPALLAAAFLCAAIATPALADPCEAPLPKRGEVFSGRVTYIGDGDGLCVDVGAQSRPNWAFGGRSNPKNAVFQQPNAVDDVAPKPGSTWVEVRLADFYAPELSDPGGKQAKRTLSRIAKGKTVTCLTDHRTWDRIAARCTLNGRSVGDLMRAAGVAEGGRGWK